MAPQTPEQRSAWRSAESPQLRAHQFAKLQQLWTFVRRSNPFYRQKLASFPESLDDWDTWADVPLTTKDELQGEGRWAANLSFPLNEYVRFHRTSGTRGRALSVPDTAADWEWWLDCWDYVLDAAQLTASDRVLLAFSFGPFIGFWSAHDALARRGAMILPGGGLDTAARLQMANDAGATALFCTPTYALRMAEVAAELGVDLASTDVRRLVVAGEPGGSIPAHRAAVESAWGAEVLDHSGATEVGAWGYGAKTGSGLHVIESEFVAETLAVETGQPAAEGELAELVLTSLGRLGCPVLRYRTGDLVRAQRPTEGDDRFLLLEGGVLGRADDMLVIRGVNVFPSSVEAILRSFPEVAEFRLTARRVGQLDQLLLEVEDRADATSRLATALRTGLGFNVQVEAVPLGSLPRFEAKAQRFIDERT